MHEAGEAERGDAADRAASTLDRGVRLPLAARPLSLFVRQRRFCINEHRIGRREALKVMGAAVVAGSVSGCGAVAGAGRVVISVAWKTITSVVSAVLKYGDKALRVIALVEEVRKELNATLNDEQANSLKSGGKLYLKTEDGKQHEIPYTVR